jgi:hypothetical protein
LLSWVARVWGQGSVGAKRASPFIRLPQSIAVSNQYRPEMYIAQLPKSRKSSLNFSCPTYFRKGSIFAPRSQIQRHCDT